MNRLELANSPGEHNCVVDSKSSDTGTPEAPLVSVVVPFLNTEKYLRECVESVLAQSYVNWELLLVDDGSTDGGRAIATEFQERMGSRVAILEHPGRVNRGVSASRNLAIARSKGAAIAFLDADDGFYPDALAKQVCALIANPEAGAIIPQLLYWQSWKSEPQRESSDFVPDLRLPLNRVLQPPALLLELYPLGSAPAPAPTGILVRRELLDKIGGFEESFHGETGLYEDQGFLCKVYLATPIVVSSECVAKYRLYSSSYSAIEIAEGHYHAARLAFLRWFAAYLRQHDIRDPRIDSLLSRAMWPYEHRVAHACLSFPANTFKAAKSIAKNILGM